MVRNSGKQDKNEERKDTKDDLDALFRLPLAEFTAARNVLAARLKKDGRGNEADFVKALVKPSISAWAVNQLYWNHRQAFDRLLSTGERFRQAQTSRLARKVTDMRVALDARREALSNLSDLATALLRDAAHNPTPETIRRITTTLEAISAYASLADGPRPGRLTQDVDPPGFESLASFVPSAGMSELKPATLSQPSSSVAKRKVEPKAEETRQARIAAAKASLQEAKSLLTEARAKAQRLEAARKEASSEAKEAEQQKREAEERLDKARTASQEAARRARNVAAEVEKAGKAVEDAKRSVEKASQELELLFRELPGR